MPSVVLLPIVANCLPLADVSDPFHSLGDVQVTNLGTEGKALGEKA